MEHTLDKLCEQEFRPYVNSDFLQLKFNSFLDRRLFDFIFHNKFLFERESDIVACKDYKIYEYEFKIGKSDFRKDFSKKRHLSNKPHFFSYVVSDLSVINGDYLDYAGIYYHKFQKNGDSMFIEEKPPALIRNYDATFEEMYILLNKVYKSKRKNG